jgi:hypothetical protein
MLRNLQEARAQRSRYGKTKDFVGVQFEFDAVARV